MTVMLLALALSDAALNAHEMSNYRQDQQEVGGSAVTTAESRSKNRAWTPGIDNWDDQKNDCPIFFQKEIKGFGTFKVGAHCATESQQ
jgi:hypothetical protein